MILKNIKNISVLVCVFLLASCVNTFPYKYKFDKQALNTNEKALVILPFNTARDVLGVPDNVQQHIIGSIKSDLEADGWSVVIGEDISESWKAKYTALKEGEGLYDSQTGNYKHQKIFLLEREFAKQALEDSGANFVLIPRVFITRAKVQSDTAGWHGTSEQSSDFWNNFLNNSVIVKGQVPASSLLVRIHDKNKLIYEHVGGIELVGKINKWNNEVELNEENFSDIAKVDNAIDISLKPILVGK
ncbi:hypothetical protein OE749_16660 [Aestuariibacter sp. AA17]|uniref:Lipoprotein n=1 Tax=Fluctibacter corallii TaxID=2984329 RepID=A0ABT3ACB7_9ALTE|nr:hypothetical protein [Aestuariibacter sp. AA17]MCV2886328.1 hypothetical protein [Aestuariibacter sp. AA17]